MIGSADEGKADVVKLLLDRGANKDAVNNVSVKDLYECALVLNALNPA